MNSNDEDALYEAALAVAAGQAEHDSDGEGVGAAGLADDGAILTGVWSGSSVLAACGVCQERLAVFGSDLLIGVADNTERGFRFESLAALRPSPWWDSIDAEKSTN